MYIGAILDSMGDVIAKWCLVETGQLIIDCRGRFGSENDKARVAHRQGVKPS